MFERFGKEARAIVTTAVAEAEARGDSRVGTEHLLIAVVGVGFPFQRSLLGPLDVGSDEIRRQLDRVDAESLAAVGVGPELLDPAFGPWAPRPQLVLDATAPSLMGQSPSSSVRCGKRSSRVGDRLGPSTSCSRCSPCPQRTP